MAYFLFTGADNPDLDPDQVQNSSDLGFLGNWSSSDASGNDNGQADRLPIVGDFAWISGSYNEGTLICDHVYVVFNQSVSAMNGATVTCIDYTDGSGITFNDCTIIGDFYCFGPDVLAGCAFTGTTHAQDATVEGGTFVGDLLLSARSAVQGDGLTVSGDLSMDYSTFAGNLPASVANRISFDNGANWYYPPSSSYVAPDNTVLTGTFNLGVPGTASPGGSGLQTGLRTRAR